MVLSFTLYYTIQQHIKKIKNIFSKSDKIFLGGESLSKILLGVVGLNKLF